ncbi:hypothetical protein C8Q80DRAFT_819415 [Daedaleopsis nitida]|nr:hypothetical protein C8Q80DRAFT_819415 [Daedaleopsis nitida]
MNLSLRDIIKNKGEAQVFNDDETGTPDILPSTSPSGTYRFRHQLLIARESMPPHAADESKANAPVETALKAAQTVQSDTSSINDDARYPRLVVPITTVDSLETNQDLGQSSHVEPAIAYSNVVGASTLCSPEQCSDDDDHHEDSSQHGSESTYVTAEEHNTVRDVITDSNSESSSSSKTPTPVIPTQVVRQNHRQDVSDKRLRMADSHKSVSFALPSSSGSQPGVSRQSELPTARRPRAPQILHDQAFQHKPTLTDSAMQWSAAASSKAESRWRCRLCFSDPCQDPVVTSCGHLFCYRCVIKRLSTRMCCPACDTFFGVKLDVADS